MENVVKSYNSKPRPLPEIMIGSRVALQNHETKWWDIYGTVRDITPHRRYFYQDAEWQGPGSQEKIIAREDYCVVASHHQFLHKHNLHLSGVKYDFYMTIPVETASEKQSIISQMQIMQKKINWV